MRKRERYKHLLIHSIAGALLLLMTAIFAYVWYRYYAEAAVLGETFYRRGNYVVIGLYALQTYVSYRLFGGMNVGRQRVLQTLIPQLVSVLFVNAMTYLQLCLIGRWSFGEHIRPMLVIVLLDALVVLGWAFVTRWIYVQLYPPKKLLAVYGEYSPDSLIKKISSRKDRYDIQETISAERDIEEVKAKICQYQNVILMDMSDEIRNKLLKFCFENDIRCYTVPKISDIMIMNAARINLFDTSLLLHRNNGMPAEESFCKRLFDIVVSLMALVILSPLMLVIALVIKLYDGGPVFFTQDRLTRGGKVFKTYKFRSMRVQPEQSEYCMTRKGDERITPVGKVLRNIHFDELPQLFNILKGDMSIVGPRPETPELTEKYCKIIPEFSYRLKVKGGLTGFAQVYGKYNTTPYDKLKLDLTYIKNYSFLLDLKLIFLTIKILFQKENTEGIESWQTSAASKENLEKIGEK